MEVYFSQRFTILDFADPIYLQYSFRTTAKVID